MGFATTEAHLTARTQEALEVRRNAGAFGLATLAAGAMAIAYGWRAASGGTTALWVLAVVLGAVGLFYAIAWYDARSPLLVADALGVRLRDGRDWHGLPWEDVADVVVHPRHGLLGDGEIEVVAHRGTGYVVPIGLATVCSSPDVAEAVRALTSGQTAVTVVETPRAGSAHAAAEEEAGEEPEPGPARIEGPAPEGEPGPEAVRAEDPAPEVEPLEDEKPVEEPEPEPAPVADVPERGREPEQEHETETQPAGHETDGPEALPDATQPDGNGPGAAEPDKDEPAAHRHHPVALVASAGRAIRANVSRSRPASIGTGALKAEPDHDTRSAPLPEARELRGTRGRVDLVFEPLPQQPEEVAVAAAPIEEWPAEAADDPVIGPQLAAVRERSAITVDGLADRTRIRPHVIEAIEVDDFAPCGGDFYARGHIRSIARVLGLDAGPLVETYDARYAHAPVDARRVFEAELATGPRPSIRLTKGGPNWAALLGVVMVLAIIWGVGQFFTGGGEEPADTPATSGLKDEPAAKPGPLAGLGAPTSNDIVLRGTGQESKVVVRDHTGAVRWKGQLAHGQTKKLTVPGRARIHSQHGDAVAVRVNGNKKGTVGEGDGRAKTVRGRH